ncbi:hypothetical protein E1B28_000024 [Marasmius oreades]|uniref:C2H2-type domain-containing protein n=1 Tax=Marasmius oreades TaxID=181124 RepID=A0A9P7V0F2_9AGAR|nr:uncharacterized protein E1B28_000024 [Marasmius oreades]KAG7098050.1 hypothetical protein E1B28_000024 [Marasmius oreades]
MPACSKCDYSTKRGVDMKRHLATHLSPEKKAAKSFHCTYPECDYRALQKSNLETHKKKHTGTKDQCCPDCTFRASDPGSLVRHRKNRHQYKPRQRKRQKISSSRSASKRSSSSRPINVSTPLSTATPPSLARATPIQDFQDSMAHLDSTASTSSGFTLPSFQEAFGADAHYGLEPGSRFEYGNRYPSSGVRYQPYYHHRSDTLHRDGYRYSLSYATTATTATTGYHSDVDYDYSSSSSDSPLQARVSGSQFDGNRGGYYSDHGGSEVRGYDVGDYSMSYTYPTQLPPF